MRTLIAVLLLAATAFGQANKDRKIYRMADGVTPPVPIEKTEPNYTPEAREAKIQGTVVLRIVIEADGTVKETEVLEGLSHGLSRKAVEAVRAWRFEPGKKDGKPVAVQATLEINFRLL